MSNSGADFSAAKPGFNDAANAVSSRTRPRPLGRTDHSVPTSREAAAVPSPRDVDGFSVDSSSSAVAVETVSLDENPSRSSLSFVSPVVFHRVPDHVDAPLGEGVTDPGTMVDHSNTSSLSNRGRARLTGPASPLSGSCRGAYGLSHKQFASLVQALTADAVAASFLVGRVGHAKAGNAVGIYKPDERLGMPGH